MVFNECVQRTFCRNVLCALHVSLSLNLLSCSHGWLQWVGLPTGVDWCVPHIRTYACKCPSLLPIDLCVYVYHGP